MSKKGLQRPSWNVGFMSSHPGAASFPESSRTLSPVENRERLPEAS